MNIVMRSTPVHQILYKKPFGSCQRPFWLLFQNDQLSFFFLHWLSVFDPHGGLLVKTFNESTHVLVFGHLHIISFVNFGVWLRILDYWLDESSHWLFNFKILDLLKIDLAKFAKIDASISVYIQKCVKLLELV